MVARDIRTVVFGLTSRKCNQYYVYFGVKLVLAGRLARNQAKGEKEGGGRGGGSTTRIKYQDTQNMINYSVRHLCLQWVLLLQNTRNL